MRGGGSRRSRAVDCRRFGRGDFSKQAAAFEFAEHRIRAGSEQGHEPRAGRQRRGPHRGVIDMLIDHRVAQPARRKPRIGGLDPAEAFARAEQADARAVAEEFGGEALDRVDVFACQAHR
jgi:hypothetical protein